MQQDSTLDDRNLPVIQSLWNDYVKLMHNEKINTVANREKLNQCRWMIEEFRINCFAQPMKTRVPISENKIRKLMEQMI